MGEFSRDCSFAVEPKPTSLVRSFTGEKNFQRTRAVPIPIPGKIDSSHSSLAEKIANLVLTEEDSIVVASKQVLGLIERDDILLDQMLGEGDGRGECFRSESVEMIGK